MCGEIVFLLFALVSDNNSFITCSSPPYLWLMPHDKPSPFQISFNDYPLNKDIVWLWSRALFVFIRLFLRYYAAQMSIHTSRHRLSDKTDLSRMGLFYRTPVNTPFFPRNLHCFRVFYIFVVENLILYIFNKKNGKQCRLCSVYGRPKWRPLAFRFMGAWCS